MATMDVAPHGTGGQLGPKRIVNDMSIQVATVNGSGSNSSNTVLLRAIFQMGVPILGICYGMQIGAQILGGQVKPAAARESPRERHV